MEMASAGKILDSSNLGVYLRDDFLEFAFPREAEGSNHSSEFAFGIASKGLAKELRELRIESSHSTDVANISTYSQQTLLHHTLSLSPWASTRSIDSPTPDALQ